MIKTKFIPAVFCLILLFLSTATQARVLMDYQPNEQLWIGGSKTLYELRDSNCISIRNVKGLHLGTFSLELKQDRISIDGTVVFNFYYYPDKTWCDVKIGGIYSLDTRIPEPNLDVTSDLSVMEKSLQNILKLETGQLINDENKISYAISQQSLEKIVPSAVSSDVPDAVDYSATLPSLIGAIQVLNSKQESQTETVNEIELILDNYLNSYK